MQSHKPQPGKGKKFLFAAILAGASVLVALALAEVLLRFVPVPGITYHSYYYNRVTGGRYYPNTINIYRSARGDYVRRRINSWGFMDDERSGAKPRGVTRIGFFGDSYTEAQQVPLDDTFVRIIQRRLNDAAGGTGPRVECLSFGISGYSMLQSYLECRTWRERADLDWVVYVFVENDPGDQIRDVKRSAGIPYAVADGDSFDIDFSFRDRFGYKEKQPHRAFQYIKSHSLVLSTLVGRLKLLGKHGIKMRATQEDMEMAATGDGRRRPTTTTPPSLWPDTLRARTAALGARVLGAWAAEVTAAGRHFAVLYMPRARELGKPYTEQDSWAEWLAAVCAEEGIELIDPSSRLLEAMANGEEVFYDHLTQDGHTAVGGAFLDYFERQ
ncbi:MAG: hypothetical protein ACE5EO_11965 [Candidatus Krumholzibacteriia bacterium]